MKERGLFLSSAFKSFERERERDLLEFATLLLFFHRCNTESDWFQIHENIIKKLNARYNLTGSNAGRFYIHDFSWQSQRQCERTDNRGFLEGWMCFTFLQGKQNRVFLEGWMCFTYLQILVLQ